VARKEVQLSQVRLLVEDLLYRSDQISDSRKELILKDSNGAFLLQVIFNGKIATPQSLLSRKPPSNSGGHASEGPRRSSSWAPRDMQLEGASNINMMIEETEFPDKFATGKLKR
jgi:hypothetical protein